MKPEDKAKREVKRILDESGCFYFKPQMGGFGKVGIPDFIACVNGYFLAVETKAIGKEPTPLQENRINEIRDSKGIALVITEENLRMVGFAIEYLEKLPTPPTYNPIRYDLL